MGHFSQANRLIPNIYSYFYIYRKTHAKIQKQLKMHNKILWLSVRRKRQFCTFKKGYSSREKTYKVKWIVRNMYFIFNIILLFQLEIFFIFTIILSLFSHKRVVLSGCQPFPFILCISGPPWIASQPSIWLSYSATL